MSRLGIQGLSWVITLVVVRLLSPHDYGLAAQAGIVSGYLAQLSELGISVGLVQKKIVDEPTHRKLFGILLVSGLCAFVILALGAPAIAHFFRESHLTWLVRLTALQFLLMPFAVIPQARLSMRLQFKTLGIIGMVANVFGGVVTLLSAYAGYGAASLIAGALGVSAARIVALNIAAGFFRPPSFEWSGLSPLFRFSATILLDRSLWYAYSQSDTILVGRLLGARSLGVYSIAMQLASIPMERAAEILSSVALPAFSSINHDLHRIGSAYLKGLRIGSALGFPIFWGLAVVAPDLVVVLFGSRWSEAVPVIQAICISMPLKILGPIGPPALTAIGKPGVSVKILVAGLLILPSSIAIGTHWGIVGAAIGWTCAIPVVFMVAAWLIAMTLRVSVNSMLAQIASPAACSLLMAASVAATGYSLRSVGAPVRLPLLIAVGATVYWSALRLLAPARLRELLVLGRDLLPARRRQVT